MSFDREFDINRESGVRSRRGSRGPGNAFALAVATCMGVGWCPYVPGTAGALVGVGVYLVFHVQPAGIYLLSTAALTALGIWAADRAEGVFGRRDPPVVVIDEVLGVLVAMAWVKPGLLTICLGFLLFRLFDIVKPPPIRWLEKNLRGGLGVVADDVLAGLYANLGVRLAVWALA